MNKRESKAYRMYKSSDMYSLYDAYGRFSRKKAEAWEYCERLCKEKDGRGLKVIGASTSVFSAGFEYEEDGKPMFMYITHTADTPIEIERDDLTQR